MALVTYDYYGILPYEQALIQQESSYQRVLTQDSIGHIIGCEHPGVFTAGRRLHNQVLPADLPFPVYKIERGGELALHNPGQLVIYPIVNFKKMGLSTRGWVDFLQTVTQQSLANLNLITQKGEAAGLWSAQGKVMFMGLRIKGDISLHGLAINVHNDLSYYKSFVSCGTSQAKVDQLKTTLSLEQIFQVWVNQFTLRSAIGA